MHLQRELERIQHKTADTRRPLIQLVSRGIKNLLNNRNDYTEIMRHLWSKIQSSPKEWRRIFKALHAMEYLVRNGAPRCIQEVKDDLFKIRALAEFSYSENGQDRGQGGKE